MLRLARELDEVPEVAFRAGSEDDGHIDVAVVQPCERIRPWQLDQAREFRGERRDRSTRRLLHCALEIDPRRTLQRAGPGLGVVEADDDGGALLAEDAERQGQDTFAVQGGEG